MGWIAGASPYYGSRVQSVVVRQEVASIVITTSEGGCGLQEMKFGRQR